MPIVAALMTFSSIRHVAASGVSSLVQGPKRGPVASRGSLPGELTRVVHCRTATEKLNLEMKTHTTVLAVLATVAAGIHVGDSWRYELRWWPTVHPAIGTPTPAWPTGCWKH